MWISYSFLRLGAVFLHVLKNETNIVLIIFYNTC